MRRTTIGRCLLSALVLGAMGLAVSAKASPLSDLAAGGQITVVDKLFSNWVVTDNSVFTTVDLAAIEVNPLPDPANNPGLQYVANSALIATGIETIILDIAFDVSTTDGSVIIKDNSLALDTFGFSLGNLAGSIDIAETVSDTAGGGLGVKAVEASPFSSTLFDSVDFAPQASVSVLTSIIITGDGLTETTSLDVFTQRFSQLDNPIPEPLSLALLSVGFAVLALTERRQKLKT